VPPQEAHIVAERSKRALLRNRAARHFFVAANLLFDLFDGSIEFPSLPFQDETHLDISSPDPLDGLVHSSKRHDIDDGLDAMRRRELEHLHGLGPTTDVVPVDGSPGIVQLTAAQR
jgi:hypothetical protein